MQGLNATNQHCSQQKSKKCAPKPRPATNLSSESTSRSSPSSTSSSSSLLSSSSTTGPSKNHKNNTLKIMFGVLAAIGLAGMGLAGIGLAVLVGTIYFNRRRRANNILPINGETERPSKC